MRRIRWSQTPWSARLAAALAALGLAFAAQADCLPAGGLPGAPRSASPVGSVLAGLGVLGPVNRPEVAIIDAASGQAGAAPACSAGATGASGSQAEPASLPAATPDRGAGNPFDVVTGAKHEHRIDLALPAVDSLAAISASGRVQSSLASLATSMAAGGTLSLQFSRFYSSGNAFSLSLGPGWSHSFDTRLARRRLAAAPEAGLPAAELQLLQADGRRIVMRPVARIGAAAGESSAASPVRLARVRYQSADPADGVVEEDPDALTEPWVWRWPSGRRLVFDTRGRLASIIAPDLDRLRLAYDADGRLASVEDRHGRSIRFAYRAGQLAELQLPDGQAIRYAYDSARRLIGVRYPDGRLVQHHYEDPAGPGWLTGTTEPDGRRSRFRYRADGRVESSLADIADADGEVRARYEAAARPGQSAPPAAAAPGSSGAHTGVTRIEHRAQTTRYHWRLDSTGAGLITSAEGPGCPVCPEVSQQVTRDARGRLTALGDWRLEHDRLGRVVRLMRGPDASAAVWRFDYEGSDPLAQPARIDAPSVAPASRRELLLRYNGRGQLIELTERGFAPYSDQTLRIARRTRILHAESGVLAGKPIAIEQLDDLARGAEPTVLARTELRFDALRRLEAIVHPEGIVHRVERDRLGRPVRESLPDGSRIVRDFDPGWHLLRLQAGALSLEFARDASARLQAIRFGSGGHWRIEHEQGRIRLADGERPPLVLGRVEARTMSPSAPALPGSLPLGLIVVTPELVQIDADGRRTGTRFDDLGRMIEERSAQRGLRQVFHDARGHPVRVALPAGELELRRFDAAGRLVEREQRTPLASATTRLDWSGMRLAGIEHPEHSVRASHDQNGRLQSLEHRLDERLVRLEFSYDEAGRLSERSLGDGMRLRYGYDDRGRPNRLGLLWPGRAEPLWLVDQVVYRAGEPVSERLGAGVRLERRFDAQGRLETLGWLRERDAAVLARFELRRHADGLLDSIGRVDGEERFGFDAAGRLIVREWQPAGAATLRTFLRYSPGGDLVLARDESGLTRRSVATPVVDAAGRTLEHGRWRIGYGASGRPERLDRIADPGAADSPGDKQLAAVGSGGSGRSTGVIGSGASGAPANDTAGVPGLGGLAKDARGLVDALGSVGSAGSPRSSGGLAHDARGVTSVASAGVAPAVQRIEQRFNAFGERVLRRIEFAAAEPRVRRFLYHQNSLAAELDRDGRILRHFIRWQGRVIAIVESASAKSVASGRAAPRIHWLLGDHLGTPQIVVDASARVVWAGRYGAYGELIDERGDFDQPLRLPGQYHDRETGLHDNYQRTYDPRRGRYLEPDPLGLAGGWNLYAYASGNPVQASDPLGLILFAFDGTGNSDPARSPDTLSNVAKFFSLYSGADRYYMSGVGTPDTGSGIGADLFDALQATSARRRVDYMLGVLDTALRSPESATAPVQVDVIGFSRGAAMARDFANTVAARISGGQYLSLQRCVSLNFVGLWDTVAQFGLNGQANAQWNLGIPPQARVVVHAVALNEQRRFFPLESIGPSTSPALAGDGWRLERGFVGDHGDIGGSHAQGDLSDVALGWMVDQARKAGLGLKALDVGWQTVTEPLLHDARSFWMSGPDREFRLPAALTAVSTNAAGAAPAAGRPIAELKAGLDRTQAETMIQRYPSIVRPQDGSAGLAGKVDMAAYSAWLAEHYGVDVRY